MSSHLFPTFSGFLGRWRRLHWATRLSVLAAFVTPLWWQTRYTSFIGNPQYGWPMSFGHIPMQWSGRAQMWVSMLVVDCVVWLILAGSTGYVVERWRRRPNRFRPAFARARALSPVIAGLLVLGCAEAYLRVHSQNGSMCWICPKYGSVSFGSMELQFDIGLFTDPIYCWPLARSMVISAIGCTIYTAGSLLYHLVRHRTRLGTELGESHRDDLGTTEESATGRSLASSGTDRSAPPSPDPAIVRLTIWVLLLIIVYYLSDILLPLPRVNY